jgi:hypothetical protein
LKEKESLMVKIAELYQKYESAPKVADELRREGIHLSSPTIFKRVRKSLKYMVQNRPVLGVTLFK